MGHRQCFIFHRLSVFELKRPTQGMYPAKLLGQSSWAHKEFVKNETLFNPGISNVGVRQGKLSLKYPFFLTDTLVVVA